jgi:hypothetical protein
MSLRGKMGSLSRRIEAAEAARRPRRKPTTAESRQYLRAFVREYIYSDPPFMVAVAMEALRRRREDRRAMGYDGGPAPTAADVVKDLSDLFIGEADQSSIVAAAQREIDRVLAVLHTESETTTERKNSQ